MNSKLKALTFSIVLQAQSLNYGEGIANISELKKLTRSDGNMYTFASRQCLRFDIVRLAAELFGWNLQVVDKSKGTVQFRDDVTIEDSEEMDLFGYMKTNKKETENKGGSLTREATVRLSNAISLEPYRSDMDFLNNKGMADRIGEHPNLANVEQHLSFYTYTVTIDLSKVGKDKDIELDNKIKAQRVIQLLEVIKILNRNIRGRQENLGPLFVIGGMYEVANPFFLGRINLKSNQTGYEINTDAIKSVVNSKFLGKEIKQNTYVGFVDGIFNNKQEFVELMNDKVVSVDEFFENLIKGVKEYYEVQ
ncbi:CRISPR-associated protein Cst2 [Alkalithermobacter thermoalcaliphilus JW-YL-7 = DSM 7308]|uniref:CRISPR-associated autoregulator, DevR family n=1 Tax=Alkalithermobacter thermoalcaliphilus JW-YL-7 = DSM 7308 TaxID=1121328 RepID=A0A150FQV7_CLOPD|nr:CRISPR-associated autoregulator, DevR family [[Clostridium] paradoxum JW-YL-7 = DSM 7308]SHL29864.1 CRISPR-associated protein Cst2 [[Clostridium] paradoxum JW-YL-7 = DSM 7308]